MKIQIIVGSTRDGRATPKVAAWVEKTATKALAGDEIELVDLAEYDLPMFSEAISPKFNPDRRPEPTVKAWLDKVAQADGYIFLTPEYNHSIPGALKNALDFADFQFDRKVATIVSHGSVGGARATEHLRNILSELGLVTTPKAVNLVGMVMMGDDILNVDGELAPALKQNPYGPQGTLEAALESLGWYVGALADARKA